MARILIAWELGANLGHVGPLSALGRELRARGHEPVFALRDLRNADALLGRHRLRYLQAPLLPSAAPTRTKPVSYSEMLGQAGFLDAAALRAVLEAWRELIGLVAPRALVFDHAPTALLAARGLGLPRILYGSGFSIPPRVDPLPNMRPWLPVPEDYLRRGDERVLQPVNRALRNLGEPALERLCDLLEAEETLLCTFAELDHYPSREGARYDGPAFNCDDGADPYWPEPVEKRVFGYLHPDTQHLETALAQLSAESAAFLWVVPGIRTELRRKFETRRFRFAEAPCRLERVLRQCDAAITNAGHGTTAALLLAGVPLLAVPRYLEQYVVARNVERLGAGLLLESHCGVPDYASALRRLLEGGACAAAAQAFAEKYAAFSPRKQLAEALDRIERLL